MEMYEDNEDAFVFLDPPYFSSYNKSYLGTEYKDMHGNLKDNTMMFIDILAYLQKSRCKIMCVLNKNAIIEHLYKDFIKGEYKKTYGVSRNKETLLIITNY
jgi:site-specific DNA-adenine methylase